MLSCLCGIVGHLLAILKLCLVIGHSSSAIRECVVPSTDVLYTSRDCVSTHRDVSEGHPHIVASGSSVAACQGGPQNSE